MKDLNYIFISTNEETFVKSKKIFLIEKDFQIVSRLKMDSIPVL